MRAGRPKGSKNQPRVAREDPETILTAALRDIAMADGLRDAAAMFGMDGDELTKHQGVIWARLIAWGALKRIGVNVPRPS